MEWGTKPGKQISVPCTDSVPIVLSYGVYMSVPGAMLL